MYILKVSANKSSFKEVKFNKTGINIIKGKKISRKSTDTYNGVGKSLLVRIIDFCLGSNEIKGFKKLKGWEFFLDIEMDNKEYKISRCAENQKKIIVNGTEYTLNQFREFFQGKIFPMQKDLTFLTFRTLLSRFLRPKKVSYVSYKSTQAKESEYQQLINLCYLLNLDLDLISEKMQTKKKLTAEEDKYKNYMEDTNFIKVFKGHKSLDVRIVNLNLSIKSLESKMSEFKVSDEYANVKDNKEEVSNKFKKIQNEIFSLNNKIKRLNNTLSLKSDITIDRVVGLYQDAKVIFKEELKKKLEEVNDFHEKMLFTRQERAKKDLSESKKILNLKKQEFKILKQEIDSYGEIFKNTGTFEEFEILSNELNKKKIELSRAKEFNIVFSENEKIKSDLKMKLQKDEIKASAYLKDEQVTINNIIKTFHNLTKEFYKDKESGVFIENNTGKNQIRYNISAEIDSDSSDGINEVKIFCFDLLLMILGNHKNNFIIHDSRLLSDIDSRQQVTLFKVANKIFNCLEKQYIISINDNMLVSMKETSGWSEVEKLFEGEDHKIVLELTDESPSDKLLGEEIKFDYEQ